MVAKIVALGSLALLIATPIAAADAPAWCGMQNLNLLRNADACLPTQPHAQASAPQVVALPTLALLQPGRVVVEPALVVAPVGGVVALPALVVKTPAAVVAFTCLPDGPLSPEACERLYRIGQGAPGTLFTCSAEAGIPQGVCDQVYAAMGKLAPGTQFTCIAQGPFSPAMCDALYRVTGMLPFGFR